MKPNDKKQYYSFTSGLLREYILIFFKWYSAKTSFVRGNNKVGCTGNRGDNNNINNNINDDDDDDDENNNNNGGSFYVE